MGKKRKRRSAATRRRWARRWRESGESGKDFAKAHGLAQSSLSRWAGELREYEAVDASPGEFVEVSSPAAEATPVSVRVVIGGVRLEFDDLPPAEYIAALGRATC